MEIQLNKWRVKKCKKPSTRWVAFRVRSKQKTGVVFESFQKAFCYASLMYSVDETLRKI